MDKKLVIETEAQTKSDTMDVGNDDKLIVFLKKVIRFAVRIMAIIMTLVILWGVADIVWVLYNRLMADPFMLLNVQDILATFGAFMAVLIAIEIFINIVIYLRDDIIAINVVLATALMAIARKVIVLDFKEMTDMQTFGIASVSLALGICYWLVVIYGSHKPVNK